MSIMSIFCNNTPGEWYCRLLGASG